jgi:hypothetical protein
MKYTDKIINGNINIEGLISNKRIFKHLTIGLALPVAFAGVIILSSMTPFTLTLDGYRYVKLQYIQYFRNTVNHTKYLRS